MRKKCITPLIWDKKTCGLALPKVPIIMKSLFYACLLSSAGLTYASNSYAQTTMVSINVENQTVKDVLDEIENTTEYSFFYNTRHVDLDRKVSVNINNADIFEVLDDVFSGTNVVYSVKDRNIILSVKDATPVITQNDNKITGTIVDASGIPVIGANVMVKGTSNGTITDMDGRFTLDVPKDAVLEVSYIGYSTQTVKVGGQKRLSIMLREDTQALDEVVVVGYGVQKKINLTGAVAQVSQEALENRPITNISSAMQGLMSGVTVTSNQGRPGSDDATIRVRGVGTLNSSEPYVLIDGVESGNLNSLDPNDIENISVLKDAASAAIYGSKASNGVILITTKRGNNSVSKLTYNGYISLQKPTTIVEKLNSVDYANLYNKALVEEGKLPRFTEEEILKFKEGSYPYEYPNTDWFDLLNVGFMHKHNLNLTGGTDKFKYMASLGYLDQSGIMPNSGRKQYNGRINLDASISKKLSVKMNMAYIKNDYSDPTHPLYFDNSSLLYRIMAQLAPWIPMEYEDGTYPSISDLGNPKAIFDSGMTVDRYNQNFSGSVSLDYSILNDLKATFTGSYVGNSQHYKHFVKSIQYNPNVYHGPNKLTERFYNSTLASMDALLNYSKKWNEHDLSMLLGYHVEKYNYKENYMFRDNFPNNELDDMNAGSVSSQTNGGYTRELAMLSYFGRITYDYLDKYLFEANFRSDASSRFSKENRWGYFPSFSAAWRISNEQFMSTVKETWLDDLKIRGSWGLLGNQNALSDYYPWLNTYSIGANSPMDDVLETGYYQGNYKLSNITWEKARTWGVGLDMALLKKITFSIEYYDRLTTDIIMDVPVPTEFALGPYKANVGKMRNSGIELAAGYSNQWNDWKFMFSGTLSYNKNEILELGGVDRMINGFTIRKIGSPIDAYYVYKADGFFQSDEEAKAYMNKYENQPGYPFSQEFKAGDLKYKDTNNDGKIDSEDRIVMNNSNPKFIYGFNVSLGWKNIDLSAIFNGAAGVAQFYHTSPVYGEFFGDMSHPSTIWLDAWSPENPEGCMPRVFEGRNSPSHSLNVPSSFWVQNTSYLRLKNFQLSYAFPKTWMDKLQISSLKVFYSGENLFTIDAIPVGIDPEVSPGDGFYPLLKTHSLGVNIQF
ncbi:MAG: TonB-dependent receptor [Parabacteroides sp.]|nr:TonB-dependent receptor [Parabacteroides sp.]